LVIEDNDAGLVFGYAPDVGYEACYAASVFHDPFTVDDTDHPAVAVLGEMRGVGFLLGSGADDPAGQECAVPFVQVAYRGINGAGGKGDGGVDDVSRGRGLGRGIAYGLIGAIEMGEVEAGMIHVQGLEDLLADHLEIGLAGDLFYNIPQEDVAGIAIAEFLARGKVEGFVFEAVDEAVAPDGMCGLVHHECGVVGVVENACRVGEQVFDGDLVAVWIIGDVFGQAVLQGEFVLFQQPEDDGGGKLFGDRTDLEDGIGIVERFCAFVLIAVAFFDYHGALCGHEYGAVEIIFFYIGVEQGIQFGGDILGAGSEGGRRANEEGYNGLFHTMKGRESFCPFAGDSVVYCMFTSHLKTAIRNLLGRRASTLIQVTGLSIGLACCALVFLFFRAERAFDKGFDGAKDIYRVTSLFKDGSRAPTTAFPYGSLLQREIPEVVAVSRLDAKRSPCIVKALDDTAAVPYLEQSGFWVDPNFFDLFSFHFLYGERKTALSAPNTIVLSEGVSQSLFHKRYPVGRRVRVGDLTYIVSGVFRQDMPNHIDAGFFATNNTEGIREEMERTLDWVADPNYYTYLRLKPGSDPVRVNEELQAYTLRHASADMKRRGEFMTNALQALTDIHLHSAGYYDYFSDKQGNLDYMYLLASIAGAVLLLACINYINLSTAQAIDRAREVGVRRVLGAAKRAIRGQFLVETVCVSGLALVIGLGLALAFLPFFNDFTGQQLSLLNADGIGLLLWLLPLALVTGLLAGLYPAIYLSSFRPVKVLKGKVSDPGALLNVRKVLVVGQFIVATGLMIGTVVIWKQLQYMMEAKTGVDEEQQLVIFLNSPQATNNSGFYMQQLQRDPAFRSVAGAVSGMVSGDMNLYPAGKSVDDHKDIFLDLVDEHYLPALGLSLVAGANFTPQVFANTDMHQEVETNDIGRQVILNEEAVKALGYTVNNAVGKQLSHVHGGLIYHYTVVGVVKNYHYFSMHAAIGPLALMPVNPRRFGVLIAKVRGSNMAAADQFAANKWRALNGDSPYTRDLLSNTFRYDYIRDRREQQMMGSFSVIAILISCLGLLGLITYSVGQKAKEIGIRKVIGARVGDIVYLFARQYLSLVLIANCIAAPLAWYLMNRWLQGFPYRIGMDWWMFAAAFGMGCVVTLATLSVKTVKAAMANPIKALRSE